MTDMNQSQNDFQNSFPIQYLNSCITSNRIYYLITASVFLIAAYFFIRLPIYSFCDTDLWYHLSGGRYFFQHNDIPQSGFFSFIANSREWPNYYWLFQILVSQIYSVSGYYGLIILKTFIFLVTISTIALFLLKNEKRDKYIVYFLFLFILFCLGLIPRYYAVLRPHIFSYLFIPVALLLLESKSRFVIFLPIITIFWSNLHGIEYPVILLIGLSYLFECFIERLIDRHSFNKENLFFIIPIVLSIWAILVTPFDFALLDAPFNLAEYQGQYIKELGTLKIDELLSLKFYPFGNLTWSALNILIIVACFGGIRSIFRKNIRISHLMLLIGGLVLLTQAERFRFEAIMLALPILRSCPLISPSNPVKPIPLSHRIFIVILLISLTSISFSQIFEHRGKYPFSYSHLPKGVTTFLNHIGVSGSVLNSPDYGGYLQWALNPEYKIAMDLQMVLFSDEDYFSVMNALNNKEGFTVFSDKFHLDFIVEKRSNHRFKEMIRAFPEYRIVFFDNASVIYVNNKAYPRIAAQYELREIDPYTIMEDDIDSLSGEQVESRFDELLAMNAIYPDGMLTNFQIGRIYLKGGKFDNAVFHANSIVNNYPEFSAGYMLKGDILLRNGSFEEAISLYKKALKCPVKGSTSPVYKKIAFAYSKTGEHGKAYKFMKRAVEIFSPTSNYKDLWQLGNMALMTGKIKEGSVLLRFALQKTPSQDPDYSKRIRRQLDKLKSYVKKQ